jgi:hypothetical protein
MGFVLVKSGAKVKKKLKAMLGHCLVSGYHKGYATT